MSKHLNSVPREDRPECTAENIPDEKLAEAAMFFSWKECSMCGSRQWWLSVPGHTNTDTCGGCGESIPIA